MTEPEATTAQNAHDNAVLDTPPDGKQKRSERLLGIWEGLLPDLSLEDFRRMRDEWSREGEDEERYESLPRPVSML